MFERRAEPVVAYAFPSRDGSGGRPSRPPWARRTEPEVEVATFGRPRPEAPEPMPQAAEEPETEPVYEAAFEPVIERPSSRPGPLLSMAPSSLRPEPERPAAPPPPEKPAMDEATQRALREAAESLVRARTQVLADVESELLELAVDIATVLVEDELASRPELHRALVRAALSSVEPGSNLRVRASRATYEGLLEAFDSSVVESGRGRVQVELDDTLEGLGAVVQAGGATVDGRVHRRLETLRRALIDARRSRDAA